MKRIEKIIVLILNPFFQCMHKEIEESTLNNIIQFIKFGIVGLSNTAISYIIYVVSLLILRTMGLLPAIDYLIAQILMFLLSVLWSFYWNNKMVFVQEDGVKRDIWKALFKSYISYAFTSLFLSAVLLTFWVNVIGISEFIAPIINLIITVPLNFFIQKFWAFKK